MFAFRPSDSPSFDPTVFPSPSPTQSPSTKLPTLEPTEAPTTSKCESINVDIINFNGFDSDDLSTDVGLQDLISNITYHAIKQTASAHDNIDSFYVFYSSVSGESEYVDGQLLESLFIEEMLCTSTNSNSQRLLQLILNEADDIEATMLENLTKEYPDGDATDLTSVSMYSTTELSC